MKKVLLTAVCSLFLTAGIANSQVVVRVGPPVPPREIVPARPYGHPDWAWRHGYHRWDGARYVWVPGAYAAPPRRGAVWVDGRWVHRGGGYVWVDGRWR